MKDESIEGSALDPFRDNDAAEFTRHLEQRAVQDVTGLDRSAMERISLLPDAAATITWHPDDVHHAPSTMPTHLDDSATVRWSAPEDWPRPVENRGEVDAAAIGWSAAPEEPDAGDAHEDAVNELAQGEAPEDFEFDRPAFAQNLADLTGATVLHQRQVYEPGPTPADPATFDLFEPHTPPAGPAMHNPWPSPPVAAHLFAELGHARTATPGLSWTTTDGTVLTDLADHPWARNREHGIVRPNVELRTIEAHLVEALVSLRAEMAARGMTDGRLAPPFPGGTSRA